MDLTNTIRKTFQSVLSRLADSTVNLSEAQIELLRKVGNDHPVSEDKQYSGEEKYIEIVVEIHPKYQKIAESLVEQGYMKQTGDNILLTYAGLLMVEQVIARSYSDKINL